MFFDEIAFGDVEGLVSLDSNVLVLFSFNAARLLFVDHLFELVWFNACETPCLKQKDTMIVTETMKFFGFGFILAFQSNYLVLIICLTFSNNRMV